MINLQIKLKNCNVSRLQCVILKILIFLENITEIEEFLQAKKNKKKNYKWKLKSFLKILNDQSRFSFNNQL